MAAEPEATLERSPDPLIEKARAELRAIGFEGEELDRQAEAAAQGARNGYCYELDSEALSEEACGNMRRGEAIRRAARSIEEAARGSD